MYGNVDIATLIIHLQFYFTFATLIEIYYDEEN